MIMSRGVLLAAVALLPLLQADPPQFLRWSASDLAQRDAALSTRVGPDHSARETLADYGNPSGAHRFRFIHRDADGTPEQHEQIEDVVFIKSGHATLQVGGDMLNRTGANGEYQGSGISGGVRYPTTLPAKLWLTTATPPVPIASDSFIETQTEFRKSMMTSSTLCS